MDLNTKLVEHIQSICERLNYILIDVTSQGHKNKQNIKVVADTESGITIDECKDLSREISDIIFRKDLVESDYQLIVTSPGLDKPLERDYEFRRNIGKDLVVDYVDISDEIKEFTGELTDFDNDYIHLKNKKNDIKIGLNAIKKARVKLKW
jgi:ribosome maturation factor RimP